MFSKFTQIWFVKKIKRAYMNIHISESEISFSDILFNKTPFTLRN